ncbi:zinc-binding dehydrogenase [Streptomyces sp. NPDC002701]|uniref:zinc-binding dehydrogenase n=1 Tax=Streptomyces sp. NPDC002701 TaxID=3364661 RepID=UPI0036916907
MRALVVDPEAVASVRLAEVAEPRLRPDQALVAVRHIGLNYGELVFASQWPTGSVHGHDAAGVVVEQAADGTGPAAGTLVAIGLAAHTWAERVAVDATRLAPVPEGVDLVDAAALGVAGVTALRVLRTRSVLGRRVLVTGASGGVGRFAVQLAAIAGAQVTASVGSVERGAGLSKLGADEVVVGVDGLERPFDLVLDTVGGPQLAAVWGLLAAGGTIHVVGHASGEPTAFDTGALFAFGDPRSITTYGDVTSPVDADLADLLGLLAVGKLSAEVGLRGSWEDIADAVVALKSRRIKGKSVLDVTGGD